MWNAFLIQFLAYCPSVPNDAPFMRLSWWESSFINYQGVLVTVLWCTTALLDHSNASSHTQRGFKNTSSWSWQEFSEGEPPILSSMTADESISFILGPTSAAMSPAEYPFVLQLSTCKSFEILNIHKVNQKCEDLLLKLAAFLTGEFVGILRSP